jgi:hypothetical protein
MFKFLSRDRVPEQVQIYTPRMRGADVARNHLYDCPVAALETYADSIVRWAIVRGITDSDLPEFITGIREYLEQRDHEQAAAEAERQRCRARVLELLKTPT